MARARSPVLIDAVLDACLDRAAGTSGAAAIWRVWDEVVGPQIARQAQPVRLQGRTLVVAVSSAPWMQELQLLKRTMRDQLNARLSSPLVQDLRLTLSAVGDTRLPHAPAARSAPPCAAPPVTDHLEGLPESIRHSFSDMLAAWRRRAWS